MIFQYYFPAALWQKRSPQLVKDAGLADVFRDCLAPRAWEDRIGGTEVARGPDKTNGVILCMTPVNGESGVIGYHPARQTWIPVGPPGQPVYWLGWETANPPRPETLRRDRLVSGYEYELGDGQIWQCPVIRRPVNQPNVPRIWSVDPAGQFAEVVAPDFEAFWQLSAEMLDVVLGVQEWEKPQTFAAAVRCLGLNYRVGPQEVSALRVLSSDNYARVFKAAVDGETLEAYFDSPSGQEALHAIFGEPAGDAKKNENDTAGPPGMSSTPGPSADCPTINPAAASCTSSPPATAAPSPS